MLKQTKKTMTTTTISGDSSFIREDYFDWLCELVTTNVLHYKNISSGITYNKLFEFLFNTPFTWTIDFDENRACDGYSLRDRYSLDRTNNESFELSDYITGRVSVLEVIIALAFKCEEIMEDPEYGSRTRQWFWEMLGNMGVGGQDDEHFDISYVDKCVSRFLNREYEPNGKGGLFVLRHCSEDLREVELGYQMNWYLNELP